MHQASTLNLELCCIVGKYSIEKVYSIIEEYGIMEEQGILEKLSLVENNNMKNIDVETKHSNLCVIYEHK